jgi:glycosyltransferase involved in cell wall biosynthesis
VNIGIVTTWFERGAAYVSKAYYETLSKHHNVFIYARGGEEYAIGDPNWDSDYVYWSKKYANQKFMYINWKEFSRWIEERNLGLIIFNEQHDWDIILKCQKLPILIGAYVDYYTKKTKEYYQLFDFLFCNTLRHYSVFKSQKQCFYIPWGTNTKIFKPNGLANENQKKSKVVFFHSAGMGKGNLRKGTDILIQAFINIKGTAELIIHSQVDVKTFGLEDDTAENSKIKFINKTIPAPGLYNLGQVYVYPTRLEGIGLTIIEALACGLPVITTDNPPMNEFVQHNINGKLVKVNRFEFRKDNYFWPQSIVDKNDLTCKMQEYVDDNQLIIEHGKNARSLAVEKLDWEKNSKNLLSLIDELNIVRSRSVLLLIEVKVFELMKSINLKKKMIIRKIRRNRFFRKI